jgi:hypothetical protein
MSDIFEDGDPFDHPAWQSAETMAGAPPRPPKGYVTCTLAWLLRVLPIVRSGGQLLVLLLIYRRCLYARCRTVSLPNSDLVAAGMSRFGKYRILAALEHLGLIDREPSDGKTTKVTLLEFP